MVVYFALADHTREWIGRNFVDGNKILVLLELTSTETRMVGFRLQVRPKFVRWHQSDPRDVDKAWNKW